MTYEELKIKLDLYDPIDVLKNVGRKWNDCWFVICDEGDCHLFKGNGNEDDIGKVDRIGYGIIRTDIRKIIIPDSVTSIGFYAFYRCSRLTNMTIPASVTYIGVWAFDNCSKLTSLVFKGKTMRKVKAIANYPFGIKDESIITCI